jgi:hypothetical protein
MLRRLALAATILLAACGGAVVADAPHSPTGVNANMARPNEYNSSLPDEQAPASDGDAPEISRSQGTAGGVVLLWPRIVGSASQPADDEQTLKIARAMQARMASLIRDKLPGVPVDVRPKPERVCPRSGCIGASVGILLTRSGKHGCTATALVARQGPSESRLVPWAGGVKLKAETSAFREPPESQVRVVDHAKCESLAEDAAARDADVVAAIKGAL